MSNDVANLVECREVLRHDRGFTLVETLVTILVLSISLVSLQGLISRAFEANVMSKDRVIAARLAAEGIELVRAKRNYNMRSLMPVEVWDNLSDTSPTSFEPDATKANIVFDTTQRFEVSTNRFLCRKLDPPAQKGMYHYCTSSIDTSVSAQIPGGFKRTVTTERVIGTGFTALSVTSTVTWTGGSVSVSTMLYPITT